MSALQVKQVPAELHEAVRRRAAEEGLTVSEFILDLLRRELARPSRREWLARLESREPVPGVDVVSVLEGSRTERDNALAQR